MHELGDVDKNPGKSSLFFLTIVRLGISLTGDQAMQFRQSMSIFDVSGAFLMTLENPREQAICLCDCSYP